MRGPAGDRGHATLGLERDKLESPCEVRGEMRFGRVSIPIWVPGEGSALEARGSESRRWARSWGRMSFLPDISGSRQ